MGNRLLWGASRAKEKILLHPARFSCYSTPADLLLLGLEPRCAVAEIQPCFSYDVSFQVALGPVKLPWSCNQRALRCPGKSLLWFSHMCLGKTKDKSVLKLRGKTLLGWKFMPFPWS